jgi:hypothetical protein
MTKLSKQDINFLHDNKWLVVEWFDVKNTFYLITQNRVVRKKTTKYKDMILWLQQNGIPVFEFKDNYANKTHILKTNENYIFK